MINYEDCQADLEAVSWSLLQLSEILGVISAIVSCSIYRFISI